MKFANTLFVPVVMSFMISFSHAQNDQLYFEMALLKYRKVMTQIDSLTHNFDSDSILNIITKDEDTIYYCDFSNSTPLKINTSLDFKEKKIVSVSRNWLDSSNVHLFGLDKNETKNDSLNLLILYYIENNSGISWVKFSNLPSTERLDYSETRKLMGHDFPMYFGISHNGARINIQNYQHGLPAEIFYRENVNDFGSFNFSTQIRRCKLLKVYTFIRLDQNVTVRIIHRGKKILNYRIRYSEKKNINDGLKHKPIKHINRLK